MLTRDSFATRDAEAAHYALLMRLAPALRHGLMGQMQAVQFLAESAVRQAKRTRDATHANDAIANLPAQAVLATARCRSLIRWLKPDPREVSSVKSIVEEVTAMLDVEFSLRDRQLNFDGGEAEFHTLRTPLVEVLTASLMALADESNDIGSCSVVATSDQGVGTISVSSQLRSGEGVSTLPVYRALTWSDVLALASGSALRLDITDRAVQIQMQAASPVPADAT